MTLISDNQSGQAQQILMRFYEELLRIEAATIDLKGKPEKDENFPANSTTQSNSSDSLTSSKAEPTPTFKIYQDNQLSYEAKTLENQWQETENPRLLGQIEVLQSLPVGTVTIAKNLQIKVNEATVLATDEQGQITKYILPPAQERTISGTEVVRSLLAQISKLPELSSEVAYLNNIR